MKLSKYSGNKWGGKYLRAPDIYFTILEKGREKLIRLEQISDIIKRNNIENFDKWEIMKEIYSGKDYQFPFLHSLKDTKSIHINLFELKSFKKTPKNKNIKYLIPDIISNRFVGERIFFIEGGNFLVNDSFFIAKFKDGIDRNKVILSVNSTLSLLMLEVIGRKNYGIGVMCIYGPEFANCLLVNPMLLRNKLDELYKQFTYREVRSIFEECGINLKQPIREQQPNLLPDRKELDDIIFDILELTEQERKEVYWAVCELVKDRLEKAKSSKDVIKTSKRRQKRQKMNEKNNKIHKS